MSHSQMGGELKFVEAIVAQSHALCGNLCKKVGFRHEDSLSAIHPKTQEQYNIFYFPLFEESPTPSLLTLSESGGLDHFRIVESADKVLKAS